MNTLICGSVIVTAVAVLGLLIANARQSTRGVWLTKPVAATGFIVTAVASGAMETTYGIVVLVALVLSWLGDVLLIPKAESIFRLGILSFLLGHVAFAVAFVTLGVDFTWLAWSSVATVAVASAVLKWIHPHVSDGLRGAVLAYVVVISVMVALAFGAYGAGAQIAVLVAALGFYCSDLAVARHRFVKRSIVNQLWGTPLYFGAQTVFALTVASEPLWRG